LQEEACQNIEYGLEFDLHGEDLKDIEISGLEGTIFDDVISLYAGLSKDQITNLVSVITGKFERCCKSYSSSMTSWLVDRFDSVNGKSYPPISCVLFFLYRHFWKEHAIYCSMKTSLPFCVL
jgi:hypothetical protein